MNDARLGTAVPWFSNIRLKVGLICGRVQDKPSCVRMIRGGYYAEGSRRQWSGPDGAIRPGEELRALDILDVRAIDVRAIGGTVARR